MGENFPKKSSAKDPTELGNVKKQIMRLPTSIIQVSEGSIEGQDIYQSFVINNKQGQRSQKLTLREKKQKVTEKCLI